ncbi:heterodisulfide reductase-related iron-sulfur binding cluster [Aeromicrobium sp. CF4.19]|uniref:heterodisulfide reductase-related iron-sulfur binding cluster n=1 Tax=Aeromicrobium sp. CF4.19 TaxID=3373082 RepID=UPI003EE6C32E
MQIVAIVVSLAITAVAVALAAKAIRDMTAVVRAGAPAPGRTGNKAGRWKTMFTETLGHTRMLQLTWVGAMHWFVMAGFIFLSTLVAGAYLQLFNPHQAFPIIGHWRVYEWPVEALSWLTLVGILYLIFVRQKNHPRKLERKSRFFGSTFWQAYFVEAVILAVVLLGILLRTLEYAILNNADYQAEHAEAAAQGGISHFPTMFWMGEAWTGLGLSTLENLVFLFAMIKIVVSMTWLIVIARNITMGVAWHRFTAWVNIWFKREDDGSVALGGLRPIMIDGKALDMEAMEELEEEDFEKLGTGKVEDFSWKGLLDFTTCTECGRCQDQCPAWNTEKPLSPKLLVMGLREHAYAKIPHLDADPESLTEEQRKEQERPLIGDEDMFGVIDPDVLWSCTNCGACVQQCPVDIEHVDHIDDMRRFQVLVESNFPAELNNIFKGLERKGNPWGMNPKHRMDWAKELDFEVKQVGVDVEDLDEVEWLFWVGCAGAFEDRAKKTTQAVAELLNTAGVDFAVLGDGETCTGDPARRAGNEVVFMQLAMENAEVLKETKAKKVVSTCAHCFNTLKNEYAEFGVELEVVHHTQLLNRLVREKKLTPVAPSGSDAAQAEDAQSENTKTITYHDPCFLGRHNQVYEAPRELLNVIPGAKFAEMPRNSEKSFCCGAGGARMWMEENLGSRINVNRTQEAVATGADQIAVGCPFCRVMLSDGLTAQQAAGEAREEVEVLDVAQMLLASVKRTEKPTAQDDDDVVGEAEAATAAAATGGDEGKDRATQAEPDAEDASDPETVTETADVGAAADAHEDASETAVEASDEPKDEPESTSDEADDEVAAEHNVDIDDKGSAHGDEDASEETAPQPADEATEPAEDESPDEDKGDEPAAEDAAPEEASEKEKAAWANVGAVNTDLTPDAPAKTEETAEDSSGDGAPTPDPEPEEGDVVEPDTEAVPAEDDGPGSGDDADPQEAAPEADPSEETVEGDAREEEAEEATDEVDEQPTAQSRAASTPVATDGEIVAVEDAPTTDSVSEDSAELTDANPSGADLSEAATAAAGDEDESTGEDDGDKPTG